MRFIIGAGLTAAIALGSLCPAVGKQVAGAEQTKLAHKIESRLRNDADLKNNRITVDVDNDHALSMVQRADGVKRVSDKMRIAAKQ
jgi:osmotically-inducible protein OsmY